MSSDSEDDCYGNIAQRLQTVKRTFKEDKIDSTNLLIELRDKETDDYSWKKNDFTATDNECGTSRNCGTTEEISLDAIIANNSKKHVKAKRKAELSTAKILPEKKNTLDSENGTLRAIRAAKRAAKEEAADILPEKKTRAKRVKSNASNNSATTSQDPTAAPQAPKEPEEPRVPDAPQVSEMSALTPELVELPPIELSKIQDIQRTTTQPNEPVLPSIFGHIVNNSNLNTSQANTTRGRGKSRGKSRGRGRQNTPRGGRSRRGSPAGRQGSRAAQQSFWSMAPDDWPDVPDHLLNPLYDIYMMAMSDRGNHSNGHCNNRQQTNRSRDAPHPTYSVGNTDEYPDRSDSQPLFSSAPKPKTQDDVIIVENDQDLEDNEELSIKVYWQSSEFVKFNLRPFQRLTPIFDHFAEQEKISHDKLLFMYNGKILKSGDTPHSINYSIVKFIDGGVINQSVSSIIQEKIDTEDGIKLKFQCINVKKPFLASIRADEKMQVVMQKCAEHLEKPLNKLKFYFDGDLISDSATPTQLELEGGECIDVNIIS